MDIIVFVGRERSRQALAERRYSVDPWRRGWVYTASLGAI